MDIARRCAAYNLQWNSAYLYLFFHTYETSSRFFGVFHISNFWEWLEKYRHLMYLIRSQDIKRLFTGIFGTPKKGS